MAGGEMLMTANLNCSAGILKQEAPERPARRLFDDASLSEGYKEPDGGAKGEPVSYCAECADPA
jgi:hypothetical protein